MLFDGLMTQSEINSLLDEIGDLEGDHLDRAEGAGLTLYEERAGKHRPYRVAHCLRRIFHPLMPEV